MSDEVLLLRVALATLVSGAVGFERESKEKPAGLRTHMLVGASSALYVGLSVQMMAGPQESYVSSDPLRIFQAVATYASILGAGTVFVIRRHVAGLTTATSLWMASALGIAMGIGKYLVGAACALLAWTILHLFHKLERRALGTNSEGTEVHATEGPRSNEGGKP